MKSERLGITTTLVIAIVWAACSSPPTKAPPKFTGRLLFLSGGGDQGSDLIELAAAPDGSIQNQSTLASGIFEATASADQTQLLYATKDEITLRDLRNSATKSVAKGQAYCLAWAPDGKHFSYKLRSEPRKTKLFASDLDGNAKLVWEDLSADNRTVNQGSIIPATDITGCANWVAPDKLVFDRYGLSQIKGSNVKPNTTTLATLGNAVSLADAERKWSVEGICKDGTAYLRSVNQGEIQIAKNFENPKTAKPVPGPCSSCRFIGFAANSCVPFFVSQSLSTTTDLFSLNPTNWQKLRTASIQHTFSPNARFVIKSSARLMVAGDAPDKLLLIDTESGDFVKLAPAAGTIPSPVPVVWIEN